MERKIFQELKAGHKFKYQFENVVQIKNCHSNLGLKSARELNTLRLNGYGIQVL